MLFFFFFWLSILYVLYMCSINIGFLLMYLLTFESTHAFVAGSQWRQEPTHEGGIDHYGGFCIQVWQFSVLHWRNPCWVLTIYILYLFIISILFYNFQFFHQNRIRVHIIIYKNICGVQFQDLGEVWSLSRTWADNKQCGCSRFPSSISCCFNGMNNLEWKKELQL